MKLYIDANYLSPYAMTAFVALREKALAFDMVRLNLKKDEHLASEYASVSSTRRVPTLNNHGFCLSESSAICEYLEDLCPTPPIYPKDINHHAKAREIQAWLRSDLMPIRQQRPTEVIFLAPTPLAPMSEEALTAASKLVDAALKLLADDALYLFGDWCIADTDLALMLNRLVVSGADVPARLVQYAQHQWQRPSVQEWVKMPRPKD